ncbi:colicin immunity domain-containing protein [Microcoleus sp. ARI1-B5]|uniref:colicin immunity domain-containing protein n=1 Tax=unclassified Microcoleus TaxID=2642155 RepID=UPI002FD19E6F
MDKYIKLLEEFVGSKITADDFEQRFIQLFKGDNNLQVGTEFKILDKLFADVDAYCSDPDLIEDPRFDIDGVQLQVSARETLDKLLKLTTVLTSEK